MKNKILIALFMSLLLGTSIIQVISSDKQVSLSERRNLKQLPKFSLVNIDINAYEGYLLDQFPCRDEIRGLKANFNYYIMQRLENNDTYRFDNHLFKANTYHEKQVVSFKQKMENLKERYGNNHEYYLGIIPDKNYYLGNDFFPEFDYVSLYEIVSKLDYKMIDFRDDVDLLAYFKSDPHLKQDYLEPLVTHLLTSLGKEVNKINYTYYDYPNFVGSLASHSGLDYQGELLTYLSNDLLENCEVWYLENNTLTSIYNLAKLDGKDSYEVFLDGASALITIENKACHNEDELIVFRDSFGSSIVPLLVPYYSKITVIDNRYITLDKVDEYITFDKQDILCLYNISLINECGSLKQ